MTEHASGSGDYSLTLSEAEIQRYRLMAEAARADEADLWQLAGITAGAAVADVGCGPGAMLPALAEAVVPDGSVIGIDGDAPSVAAAQALVAAAGLANVIVRSGRAEATGLDPASVDVVMLRHVLAHNGPREQEIVDHVATLVRPGGCVFLVDSEGSAIRVRPSDPDLEDLQDRYRSYLATMDNDFQTGLRLARLLEGAGLEVLQFRGRYAILRMPPGVRPPSWAAREAMLAAGIADRADVARWAQALERADAAPPTVFAPVFAAVGRRSAV